jgi:hypothetical protein
MDSATFRNKGNSNLFILLTILQNITMENLEHGNPGSCDGLKIMYDNILKFIQDDCS